MKIDPTSVLQRVEVASARRRLHEADAAARPRPYPDRPIGTESLPEIGPIVVLMMENHSYDNYLGLLERGDGLPKDNDGNPTTTNLSVSGEPFGAHHQASTKQLRDVPTQSWLASHEQWNDGHNDGFVRSAEHQQPHNPRADPSLAMGYWNETDLPFYYALARTFPLADRWFSSCLGPTFPNRRFLVAGTAHGLTSDSLSRTFDYPDHGTIFDLLTRHGISWANYHQVSHVGPVMARVTGVHGLRAARKARTGIESEAKSFLQFTADAYPLGLVRYLRHVRSMEHFIADAANGRLPAVSIVDPDFRNNSEENPQDIQDGEAFAARVIDAVMHGRQWPTTLLIWVYDEHGGYYDHVAPPEAPEPDDHPPEDGGPWRYDRYGFRVPAVIVSPYARPDYVSHVIHDHTSILKLIETKWNLPALTRRDAAADDLLDSLDLSGRPAFAHPPPLPPPALGFTDTDRH